MKQEFLERIIKDRAVDTAKYRYIAVEEYDNKTQWLEIRRKPLKAIDTTAPWEIVKKIY